MARTMYDGVNTDAATIARLAKRGDLVLYYIDGRYAWTAAEIASIPAGVEHVTCTVLGGSAKADVVDCEAGDTTPPSAAQWVRNRKAEGYWRPTIYCSLSTALAVRQATGSLILARDYDMIVADYDNSPASVYSGAAGKQYKNTAGYDVTEVYDDGWPHRTAPAAAPKVFGPVRDFREVNVGPHSFKASWSSPLSGPTGVGYYDFVVMNAAGTTVVQRHEVPKTTVSQEWQVNDLTPDTGYQAWIRACANGAQSYAGPWSKLPFRTTSG